MCTGVSRQGQILTVSSAYLATCNTVVIPASSCAQQILLNFKYNLESFVSHVSGMMELYLLS